jgi:site-specific recombinase XerD
MSAAASNVTAIIPSAYHDDEEERERERQRQWQREAQATSEWLQSQLSPQTRRAYASDLRAFGVWAQTRGITSLCEVTRRHLLDWRDEMRATGGYAAATIARRLSCVRQLMEAGAADGWLPGGNPAKYVKPFRVPGVSPRHALDHPAARALLAQPDRETLLGARDYAILCVLLYLGLRRSEVADLTLAALGTDRSHVTLRVCGKGEKVRVLPVPPVAHEAIRAYLAISGRAETATPIEPLFVATRANQHTALTRSEGQALVAATTPATGHVMTARFLDDETIWRRVRYYARKAGLTGLDAHTLRHTALSQAIEGGATLHQTQVMAGHADPKTTTRYLTRMRDLDESAVYKVHYA